MKSLVGSGVEGGLREIQEASEADDEAVDFAKRGEAEDLGGVVAVGCVSKKEKTDIFFLWGWKF